MNAWIWDALLPGWREWSPHVSLVGVGTILNRSMLASDGRRKLVLGSGVGYNENVDLDDNPNQWDVRSVRGPLSAQTLGLDRSCSILDPAAMLPLLSEFSEVRRTDDLLVIPHHNSVAKFDWPSLLAGTPLTFVDPRGDAREIIHRIAGCKGVIAESMHAAIIADAFRVPWRAVTISNGICLFKWQDWGASLSMTIEFKQFFAPLRRLQTSIKSIRRPKLAGLKANPPANSALLPQHGGVAGRLLTVLARREFYTLHRGPFQLSNASALADAQDRFAAMLETVKHDYS